MRLLRYLLIIIAVGFFGILGASLSKEAIAKEESYALKQNYSYLYNETERMNIILYSNIKTPRFSYIDMNKYYLTDFDEDILLTVKVNDISIDKDDTLYMFVINIDVLNFNHMYIDELYFKASNDYGEDRFNIGTFNVVADTYESSLEYKSLNKNCSNNLLYGISIELNEIATITGIEISEAFNASYSINGRTISLSFDSKNYTYELYVIINTSKGMIKINRYVVNNSRVKSRDVRYALSAMERVEYND